jgi:hypothetical protein
MQQMAQLYMVQSCTALANRSKVRLSAYPTSESAGMCTTGMVTAAADLQAVHPLHVEKLVQICGSPFIRKGLMMNLYTYASAGSDSTPWEVTATSLAGQGSGDADMLPQQHQGLCQ